MNSSPRTADLYRRSTLQGSIVFWIYFFSIIRLRPLKSQTRSPRRITSFSHDLAHFFFFFFVLLSRGIIVSHRVSLAADYTPPSPFSLYHSLLLNFSRSAKEAARPAGRLVSSRSTDRPTDRKRPIVGLEHRGLRPVLE